MSIRTDLAIELSENLNQGNGIKREYKENGKVNITEIEIISPEGEKALNRKKGKYITLEFPNIFKIPDYTEIEDSLISELKNLISDASVTLVVGLGNTEITPDSIGPYTAEKILATRHISGQFAKEIGLEGLKSVAVISPGVLGKTGIETTELVKGAAETVKPSAVIVIDALAAKSSDRLYRTIQLSNTGISPGSGVKNSRKEISADSIGVPVIAIGVPTVVDANTLAFELTGKEGEKDADMFVTPKEVDLLTHRVSEILAAALNRFLQPEIDKDILNSLV